jgi:8-amino-7-oxononanoate synthase
VQQALKLAAAAEPERQLLANLGRYLRGRLGAAGFDVGRSESQIVPVMLGSNQAALRFASALESAGFSIRPLRPPTVPEGTSRLRLSLHARLSPAGMDALVETLVATRESEVVRG